MLHITSEPKCVLANVRHDRNLPSNLRSLKLSAVNRIVMQECVPRRMLSASVTLGANARKPILQQRQHTGSSQPTTFRIY